MALVSLSSDERERLNALLEYQILDTDTDPEFDLIVDLACEICQTPKGCITLVDAARQWFKSRKGVDDCETDRKYSFCSYTIRGKEMMVVPDTYADDRFKDNPYVVGYRGIRFYAGEPLITDGGHAIGALCVMDVKPRVLTDQQMHYLKGLARQVMNLLNLRQRNIALNQNAVKKEVEFKQVLNRISDSFLTLDSHWNFTFVNAQLANMVRRDPADLIGKNVWDEFPEVVGSETYHALHTAMRERKYVCNLDYNARFHLWQENHIYPTDEGICVFVRDITDRKQGEERLLDSIERLERAEQQAKVGSWTFELATGKRHWSRQMFLMFGYEPADQPPSTEEFLLRLHPEDRHMVNDFGAKLMKGVLVESIIIRSDPTQLGLRYFLSSAKPKQNASGEIIAFEGTLMDITEMHRINRELDHFVYSVSHDLRAPLTTILGILNWAQIDPKASASQCLNFIRDQVNRLDGFIKDILDYSTNARTDLHLEEIDLEKVVDTLRENARFDLQKDRIQITTDLQVKQFVSDRRRLEIIFNNLYSNAVKFQDQRKSTCSIHIVARAIKDQVEIEFTDNGIGIESIYQPKIFDMFFRASPESKGSGLGLYIVKEAVSRLTGSVEVFSAVNEGTTMRIVLPMLNL